MSVNSLPKTVTRQHRNCDLNPGPSVPESSTLTTRLPSHPVLIGKKEIDKRETVAHFVTLMWSSKIISSM